MYDNWHRIERVVKWTGLSVNAFSRVIGLNRSENLYQIKRGNNGISRELAETISTKYPTISKGWLLSGEGDMFVVNDENQKKIPYYNTDITHLVTGDNWENTDQEIILPMSVKCDFAANFIGESMKPTVPSGSMVVCVKAKIEDVVFGAMYMIVAKNFIGVRYLRSDTESKILRAVPANTLEYDTISIKKSNIDSLYRIVTVIVYTL